MSQRHKKRCPLFISSWVLPLPSHMAGNWGAISQLFCCCFIMQTLSFNNKIEVVPRSSNLLPSSTTIRLAAFQLLPRHELLLPQKIEEWQNYCNTPKATSMQVISLFHPIYIQDKRPTQNTYIKFSLSIRNCMYCGALCRIYPS